jgi:beta-glucanase (GH16 family)
MPSFLGNVRALVATLVIAFGAVSGVASADAKVPAHPHHATTRQHAAAMRHATARRRQLAARKHALKLKRLRAARAKTARTAAIRAAAKTAVARAASATEPAGISGHWKLALNSEFDQSSLPADWATGWFGSGVTAGVSHSEPDCYSPNNVTFPGDGSMHINLTATQSTCNGKTEPYTTGLVTTNPSDGRDTAGFQYSYGVLEARVYVPASGSEIANWPAVWADGQSWPNDGEDDVMEGLGGQACWHFHDTLGGPGQCSTKIKPGWHTFASDWQPGSVTYYYDGTKVGSITTGITSAPMYIILGNAAVQGGSTVPDSMRVQYVRVWQS